MQDHAAGHTDNGAEQNADRWRQNENSRQPAKSRSERQAQNKSVVQATLPTTRPTAPRDPIVDPTKIPVFCTIGGALPAERAAFYDIFSTDAKRIFTERRQECSRCSNVRGTNKPPFSISGA